jgi:uncharacterized protein (DUF885 family)
MMPESPTEPMADAAEQLARRRAALRQLLEAHWDWTLENNPELASYLGDRRWNDRLTDFSFEAIQRRLNETKVWLRNFEAIDVSGFPEQEILNSRLIIDELSNDVEDARWEGWLMPVNQMDGIHLDFPQLISLLTFQTEKDYEDLIARYRSFPTQMEQVVTLMREGARRSLMPPRFLLEVVGKQAGDLASVSPEDHPLALPITRFPESIDQSRRARLKHAVLDAVRESLIPAYRDFARFVREEYAPSGREHDGIWALPDGLDRYANRIRRTTTTDLTAAEIHQIGLGEVARIREEMHEIARTLGHHDPNALDRAIEAMPELKARSRQQIIDIYQHHTRQMYERLPELFGRLPKAPLEIVPVETWREENEAMAMYFNPAPDGSRPGRVMVNTHAAEKRKTITMESTAYHEGVPGHHMQLAIQQEIPDLPSFRQQGGHTAFVEGWALYSEALGKEVGFFEDPYSDYGRLQDEILRAIRLVVDTGLHAMRWKRQQVVDYFRAHSALDELDIQTETDRYIVWPGQALGYKIGQLRIVELRERARDRLGDRFDIRAFHDLVLGSGSLPLHILEERVEQWIGGESER